ncbi:hypothetical protein BGZ74_000155 [Mortierella antarctica]|nr:hypothetical protein BGZ74_000155 [Mortierella antarctica]
MELCFRNVQLQDKRDWALLIDSVDLSLLQTLDLGDHGFIQFLVVPDALYLFVSQLEATHLEAECQKLVLPSFMLDTTTLLQTDLARVQKILSQCCLKKLVVKCDLIKLNVSDPVVQVLDSMQWSLLEHLILSGDNINQWIQLLAKIDMPQLKTLQIWGTKSMQQELSHESVLFIERLIGTSSLSELYFDDVLLQDQRDWARLVEKMDPAILENIYLGDSSHEQFMVATDVGDLISSKRPQLAEDLEEDDSEYDLEYISEYDSEHDSEEDD